MTITISIIALILSVIANLDKINSRVEIYQESRQNGWTKKSSTIWALKGKVPTGKDSFVAQIKQARMLH